MITKYGYTTLSMVLAICLILAIVSFFIHSIPIRITLTTLIIFLLLFTLNFFRDPERVTPTDENCVISPADGTVLFVKDVTEEKFLQGKAKQISIFMSPLNVHVNRIPITGKVEYLQYHKGEYLVAYDDKASEKNERNEIGISGSTGKVLYTQIAGFVARRIVSELNLGDSVIAGKRFGMIKFGSRVDVIVPETFVTSLKKGAKVFAGETILFVRQRQMK
ncbi:MAG: phosphatidylserine decarboxylase family protein [Ignavibacteria bacterium CG22_combo_CG10-13_8_21_14_all_37_15]|nr:MAG: phosphatidylserine decarboxylase family protein [Ignavibacteria bacterium CG22_combo_CG10-13_8_21_14_all_37_15]PJC59979.1 MAG: phosphatidylserine decarboxylase family protein [Ignavibacteria bacterium CG_4_9_14_0_2_um_filter_37_13]